MARLTAQNITKMFGTDVVLADVSFEIQDGEHIGLVGINGSGKTTLFKILTGEYDCDNGMVVTGRDTRVGYMEQHVCRDLDKSAYNEVLTVFSDLLEMEKQLEEISAALQTHPQNMNELILKQAELNDRFNAQGGLTCRSRARSTLMGLGFTEEQIGMPVGVLSGGQKAKLQLAKMLLCGANLLLLDEPTNHLDIPSVEWLEDFLRTYNGAYVVISHDRYFLDRVTEKTFEIEHNHLTVYKGNYSVYLQLKEEQRLARQRVYDNTQKEIARLEGIIEQQKRWNQERNYVTIASKQKAIDRLKATLDKPENAPDSIHFNFHASQRGGNDVLDAEGLSLSFDGHQLFKNVGLRVRRQEKIFLIGPNGCGKTSLFKVLLGQYTSPTGFCRFGTGIDIGYYDQLQTSLDESKTVIDEIWDAYPRMTETEVRSALAVFLFKGEDVFKPVSGLSGGERARVLLLRLMLSKCNFLLLDEPTNHLDIDSCEALENALAGYDGTLLIVSHDRYLINKLADRIYCLEPDGTKEYIGNYDAYLEKRAQQEEKEQPKAVVKVNEYKLRKERESEIRKKKSALARCEKQIDETDAQIEEINATLQTPEVSSDYVKTLELTEQLGQLKEKADELMSQWSDLTLWLEENTADSAS